MEVGKSRAVPPALCLACGHMLDQAACVDGDNAPKPGDLTMCINCGHVMAFDHELKMAELSAQERRDIANDKRVAAVIAAKAAVAAREQARRAGKPFFVQWYDSGHEPRMRANPEYPDGVDLDTGQRPACKAELPYPAARIGYYVVECLKCGVKIGVTSAGRRDDPRSVMVPCQTTAQDVATEVARTRPHQLGWLRRPELDNATMDAWERPDGTLYAAEKGKEPVLEKLKPWPQLSDDADDDGGDDGTPPIQH